MLILQTLCELKVDLLHILISQLNVSTLQIECSEAPILTEHYTTMKL
jgi:hypothetical protein